MADQHMTRDEKASQATRKASRIGMIALAALLVIALLSFFLLGNNNSPGPLTSESDQRSTATETSQSFADTQVVQPNGQEGTIAPVDR